MKYRKHRTVHARRRSLKIPRGVSREETALLNAIHLEFPQLMIYRSDRQVLHGKEIDIWIPSKKLGIEYNGNFFHSSDTKDASYHLYKTLECEKQNIQLIHIFSDEWETKRALVVDHIRKILGKYQVIKSEDCVVSKLTLAEGKFFMDNSDLLGSSEDTTDYISLKYDNDIVACLGYHIDSNRTIIDRYTERKTIKVNGGLHELLNGHRGEIIAKVDRRLYSGKDFLEEGFKKVDATPPKTYYMSDFLGRILETSSKLTEAQKKKMTKIWDCGDIIFKKIID